MKGLVIVYERSKHLCSAIKLQVILTPWQNEEKAKSSLIK